MGLFDKIKEPVFLKEDSASSRQLSILEELLAVSPADAVPKLEQEIRSVKAGIIGEQQVIFELRNSHIPMYVLHDVFLEFEGLTAQIDFLVLTRGRKFIIECKNLYGNVEITRQGDFIRNIGYNGKFFKERIYSPITQNERHLALIKKVRAAERTNLLTLSLFEKNFYNNYRSVVVLANPKTILNDKYAKKEIKNQVVSADHLVAYIKEINSGVENNSEKDLTSLANFFLDINKPAPDYAERYSQMFHSDSALKEPETSSGILPLTAEEKNAPTAAEAVSPGQQILCPKCGAPMVLRTATKGPNAGNSFYGCSQFPKCRNIINLKS